MERLLCQYADIYACRCIEIFCIGKTPQGDENTSKVGVWDSRLYHEQIIDIPINQTQLLLENVFKNVKELVAELNFLEYFTPHKYFKWYTEIAPQEYRANNSCVSKILCFFVLPTHCLPAYNFYFTTSFFCITSVPYSRYHFCISCVRRTTSMISCSSFRVSAVSL